MTTDVQSTADERQWAMFANLAGLLALANIPFANIAGPLIIYFRARKERSAFVLEHARRSLNFQITFSIFMVVVMIFALIFWGSLIISFAAQNVHTHNQAPPIGFIAWFFVVAAFMLLAQLANVILCVLGGVAASSGRMSSYPAIPFVR